MIEKQYHSINEAADLLKLPAYVLRYWEKEFKMLRPKKNRAGRRVYTKRDINIVLCIKKLLYDDGFTIEGARKRLLNMKEQEIEQIALPFAEPKNVIKEVKGELAEIKKLVSSTLTSSK